VGAGDESAHVARDDRVKAVRFVVARFDALAGVEADVRGSCVRPLGVAVCDELAVDDTLQRL
jgi:hypothetical protein